MNRLEQARKLGEMLRSLMHDRGWTAREMARQADIPPSTLSNYLIGLTFPTKEKREQLATLFRLEITEFDALFGLTTLPAPKIEAMCRDIRGLNASDFAIVAKVVFERALADLENSSSLPPE